jgi:hypothetical protein
MKQLLCVLFIYASVCYGQNTAPQAVGRQPQNNPNLKDTNKKYAFFSFDIGIGIPQNNYGTATNPVPSNENQSYALTGIHSNISFGVFLTTKIAFVADFGVDINSADQALFAANNGGDAVGDYKVWQYMAGLRYQVVLKPKVNFRVQAMAGYLNVIYPSVSYINIGYSIPTGNGLGYSIGAGLEKMLNPDFGIAGNIVYTGGQTSYTSPNPYGIGVQLQNETMWFGSIQITVGAVVHL